VQTKYKNQSYREMSINLKRNFLSELGYNGVYLEKSILGDFYQGIINPDISGQKEFQMLFSGIKDLVSDGFTDFHTDSLQYLTDDRFWKISQKNLNTTSNTQIGGTLNFTLEYIQERMIALQLLHNNLKKWTCLEILILIKLLFQIKFPIF